MRVHHIIATRALAIDRGEGRELVWESLDTSDVLHRLVVGQDTPEGVVLERHAATSASP